MTDTKDYNRATKFFRDMESADPYDMRWGKFADAMDEVISTYVPVVRCKDCKHAFLWVDKRTYHCGKEIGGDSSVHDCDWFCADGERREENDDY